MKVIEPKKEKMQKSNGSRNQDSAAEVAKRLDISLMTVSRVFNGSELVNEVTRRKVLEVAKELGYQPNIAARALRTGRSGLVAFLMDSFQSLRGEFHTEAFAAFESIMATQGLNVMISIAGEKENIAHRAKNLIATNRCEAIAMRFDTLSRKDFNELNNLGAPLVLMNYNPGISTEHLKIGSIGFDNKQGTQHAVRYLASMGHKRIAFLKGTQGWLDAIQREQGFRTVMKEMGLVINEKWIQQCSFGKGYTTGYDGMIGIFAMGIPSPTAVVCASDEIASGALAAAFRWGKSVPKDFSIVGFDDAGWSAFLIPPLTTVRHSGWELGEQIGRYLLELIDNPNTAPKNIILETKLIVRESTGVAPSE